MINFCHTREWVRKMPTTIENFKRMSALGKTRSAPPNQTLPHQGSIALPAAGLGHQHCIPRLGVWTGLVTVCLLLAACAGPSRDISRIPAQTDAVSSKDGAFTQPVKWARSQPGCEGDCPRMRVDSLVFPGKPRLTELVDHTLANMTGMGEES